MTDQLPNELYMKIAHDGRDYFMLVDDKISALTHPGEAAKIGVYRLVEIREVKGE